METDTLPALADMRLRSGSANTATATVSSDTATTRSTEAGVDSTGAGPRPPQTWSIRSRFFDFAIRPGVRKAPTVPGGTADPARTDGRGRLTEGGRPTIWGAGGQIGALDTRRIDRSTALRRVGSCLSWVPVTEYGDPETRFGYAIAARTRRRLQRGDHLDRSQWDDPDYELWRSGRDDPGRGANAGTSPEKASIGSTPIPGWPSARSGLARGLQDRPEDLSGDVGSTAETVDDLFEPVEEFELFDQCMFTIGISQYGSRQGASGYGLRSPVRAASGIGDGHDGFDRAEHYFLVFPARSPRRSSATRMRGVRTPTNEADGGGRVDAAPMS